MTLNCQAYIDAIASHAEALGWFERVTAFEPKSAPGAGLSLAVWFRKLGPIPQRSSLNMTTGRVELSARAAMSFIAEPQDAIDSTVLGACDGLMAAYSGDFTLGGLVSDVDLLGAYGDPLASEMGYQNIDSKMYRVCVITIPLVVNDIYQQAP